MRLRSSALNGSTAGSPACTPIVSTVVTKAVASIENDSIDDVAKLVSTSWPLASIASMV